LSGSPDKPFLSPSPQPNNDAALQSIAMKNGVPIESQGRGYSEAAPDGDLADTKDANGDPPATSPCRPFPGTCRSNACR